MDPSPNMPNYRIIGDVSISYIEFEKIIPPLQSANYFIVVLARTKRHRRLG